MRSPANGKGFCVEKGLASRLKRHRGAVKANEAAKAGRSKVQRLPRRLLRRVWNGGRACLAKMSKSEMREAART